MQFSETVDITGFEEVFNKIMRLIPKRRSFFKWENIKVILYMVITQGERERSERNF